MSSLLMLEMLHGGLSKGHSCNMRSAVWTKPHIGWMLPGPSLPCSLYSDRLQYGAGLVLPKLFWGTDIHLVLVSVQ